MSQNENFSLAQANPQYSQLYPHNRFNFTAFDSCAAGYDIRWLLRAITRLAAKRSLLVLLKLAMPGRISVNVSRVSMLWLDLSTTQQGDRTRRFWGELDDVEKVGLTGVVHDLAAFDRLRGADEALALRSGGLHEGLELDDAGPPSMMVR